MDNLAYTYQFEEEPDFEIIEGERFFMPPAPTTKHETIVSILGMLFHHYIFINDIKAVVLPDNTDIHFSDEDHCKPDLSVVCNLDIVDWDGPVKGAPDLVVEVLSKSTMKRDIGVKKNIYAKYGVKEYWIVNPWSKSIEVYYLIDGTYVLDEVYKIFSKVEWERLTDKEREESKFEIKVSLFEDLFIDIRKVFKWWLED